MKKQKRYVGVVIKNENKFLLCKRNSDTTFPGMWSIPAGKLEQEEETKEAAKREFFEETAISLEDKELEFVGLIPRTTRDGQRIKGLMYVYMLDSKEQLIPDLLNAIDGEEHTECGYFSIDEIDENKCGGHLLKLLNTLSKK